MQSIDKCWVKIAGGIHRHCSARQRHGSGAIPSACSALSSSLLPVVEVFADLADLEYTVGFLASVLAVTLVLVSAGRPPGM